MFSMSRAARMQQHALSHAAQGIYDTDVAFVKFISHFNKK